MTPSERRMLGRFDTPWPLAQALADWAIRDASDTVLEPSCGGGVLIKSAIARLTEKGNVHPHKCVLGCDIDPRAINESRNEVGGADLKLVLGNFLELTPPAFGNIKFDVILGNPPYVRLHTMDELARQSARKSLPAKGVIGAKASLWAYFPIHAYKFLAIGGRAGWILPEILLHAEYGKQVLSWATQNFSRCIAVSLRERCFLANGAKERVVILLLSGAGSRAASGIEMLEYNTARECIEVLPGLARDSTAALPQLNGHAVPHLISTAAANASKIIENAAELKRFGDFASVKIGVVTGKNKFFVLTEEQRAAAKIPLRHFQRVIGKFDKLGNGFRLSKVLETKDFRTSSSLSWLLCPNPDSVDQRLNKYLLRFSQADIDENKTMAKRSHWQVPTLGKIPDAFFRCMGKNGVRIVLNEKLAYCTNTIHRVFFKEQVSNSIRRAICLSLHSSYSQLSAEFEGRQYGSGVLKFEPSEAARLLFATNESLTEALAGEWFKLTKEANIKGWESVVPVIDALIALHCPDIAKALPVETVRLLLTKVRQRRNSIYVNFGTSL